MDINIEELIKLLPEGYKEASFETKAIERQRIIKTPEELIVMCLYYIYGATLIETSQLAGMNWTGQMSDVAFMKRFIKCNGWFQWITENIKPDAVTGYQLPEILKPYHVVAIDASDVYTKGAIKQAWHLHYSVDLFSLNCSQFKITEESTGETLKNFTIQEKDLIIADRAVATSLPETFTAEEILNLYRLRWQVEMVFKRYKSILGLGSIPTKTKESTEAWLNGKMLVALLVEKFLSDVDFPPMGKMKKNRSIWRETKLVFLLIFILIMPKNNLPFGQDFLRLSIGSFVEKRKKDRLQMVTFSLS